MPRSSLIPVVCLVLLSERLGAPAWAQALQFPGAKGPSPQDLGENVTLAAAHQLCSIVQGGRVVCNHAWYRDISVRANRLRSSASRSAASAASPQGTSLPGSRRDSPWQEVFGLRDVISLTAGRYYLCALTKQGAVKCWGQDNSVPPDAEEPPATRLFGEGAQRDVPQPAPLRGASKGVVAVAAQDESIYLRRADGSFTALMDSTLRIYPPKGLARSLRSISRVSSLFRDICYLDSGGRVHCQYCRNDECLGWAVARGFAGPVTQIGITCGGGECRSDVAGLTKTGQIQLCPMNFLDSQPCPQISNLPAQVVELVRNCARSSSGDVYCWMMSMGQGVLHAERIPLPEPAVELAARGNRVQCARLASGKIACFIPEARKWQMIGPPVVIDAPRLD